MQKNLLIHASNEPKYTRNNEQYYENMVKNISFFGYYSFSVSKFISFFFNSRN